MCMKREFLWLVINCLFIHVIHIVRRVLLSFLILFITLVYSRVDRWKVEANAVFLGRLYRRP